MRAVLLVALSTGILIPAPAAATFSIVACDASRACGAAVATNNLAVGASVIGARAGVGAVTSQFETNPGHVGDALRLLADGASSRAALDGVLAADGRFDGQDIDDRQVGIAAMRGSGAAHTGAHAARAAWAGALEGERVSIQGNGLVGAQVLAAMRDAWQRSSGALAERLMAAIEAGEAAGGQSSGRLSAALLVRTVEGGWQDVDLRVDAAANPIGELRRLFGMRRANDALVRAERAWRRGDGDGARRALAEAATLAPGWDRVWRRSARLHLSLGDVAQARMAFAAFAGLNPAWARRERDDPFYAPIAEPARQD